MMRTGDVMSSSHPQSFSDRAETLNISPKNVTISTCPIKMTNAM